jgi:hypothetical protein
MDISSIINQIRQVVLEIVSNPILADVFLAAFLIIMGINGVKKGYWFALWNFFLSFVTIFILLAFFLNLATSLVTSYIGPYLDFGVIDLNKTMAMFLIVTAVLLFGWIIFGFIYLIFTPIKGRNYSYRSFDPMVVTKVKAIGFTVGLLEGIVYVLLYNVVLVNLTTYGSTLFTSQTISTFIATLNPNNSIILSQLNALFEYGQYFGLTN